MADFIVYTAYWQTTILAAGAPVTSTFVITQIQRKIKVRSIIVDLELYDVGGNLLIPFDNATTAQMQLRVGDAPTPNAKGFETIAGTAPTQTGNYFYIFRPCQLDCNSFFCSQELEFFLSLASFEAGGGRNIRFIFSLVVEIETKIMY